jgi:hypothetical protein
VAAMSAIAKYPEIMESLFMTKEFNSKGIYAVRLYVRGKPWLITVDDRFLFHTKLDNLRFASYNVMDGSLWAPILEKAIAKVKGNYYQLVAGIDSNALRTLTGAPVFSYNLRNSTADFIWDKTRQATLVDYLSIASVDGMGYSDSKKN